MNDKVGLCMIFDAMTFNLLVYTLDSYELAKAQAIDIVDKCRAPFYLGETIDGNGLRECGYRLSKSEIILVRESQVGHVIISIGERK